MSLKGLGIPLEDSFRPRWRSWHTFAAAVLWLSYAAVFVIWILPLFDDAHRYIHRNIFGWSGIADMALWVVLFVLTPIIPLGAAASGRPKNGNYVGDWSVFTKVLVVVVFTVLTLFMLFPVISVAALGHADGWLLIAGGLGLLCAVPPVYVIRNWSRTG